jgi:hypothetical protein
MPVNYVKLEGKSKQNIWNRCVWSFLFLNDTGHAYCGIVGSLGFFAQAGWHFCICDAGYYHRVRKMR